MYAMFIESIPNRKSPPAILLRESYREGGKTRKRTLANLSHLPPDTIASIGAALRGGRLFDADADVDVAGSLPCGHVKAVRLAMERLDMAGLVSPRRCRERDVVLAVLAQRLVCAASKLETAAAFRDTTVASDFGVADADENDIYEAMDWLLRRQEGIEDRLAKRHLGPGAMAFYDLSCSSYHGTHCPLAKRGYNRDGLSLPAVEYGLLTDAEGRPVAVQVYEGDTGDPETVADQVSKLTGRFGVAGAVVVGDRGMLTSAQIRDVCAPAGLGWISCLRSDGIAKLLAAAGAVDTPLFSKGNMAEITHPDFPGERLVACYNEFLAQDRARTREELLAATERQLEKIRDGVEGAKGRRRESLTKDVIGVRVGRAIDKYKVAKHFRLAIGDGSLSWSRDEARIKAEAALDGIYVVRTNVPAEKLGAPDAVRAYKRLGNVEKAFRTFKGVDLRVRPIHHRLDQRVRCHILLCMLAYYVEWHMRRALAPLTYAEEDLEAARQSRDPVAKAGPTPAAKAKKATGESADGLPLRTWKGLLDHLATIVRSDVVLGKGKACVTVTRETRMDACQQRAFELLREDADIWRRVQ